MEFLNNVIEENRINLRYQVTGIDLNPKEKETNPNVYGAIWFDRECSKKDLLREPGIDGEIIYIINDATPDGANFRYLFSLVGFSGEEWVPDIKIGALYQLVGSLVSEPREGRGTIINS